MTGVELKPESASPTSTTEPDTDQRRLNEAHKRLTTATIGLRKAKSNAAASPDDSALQAELVKKQKEFDKATDHLLASADPIPPASTLSTEPSNLADWDRRHNQAYRLLQMSLSDQYKELTFDCTDLSSTWQILQNHFESKAAADVMAAEAQLEQIKLGENDDVLEFLNEIRLIRSALRCTGEPIADRKLFLSVIRKLPKKMQSIQETILYGPEDRKTYASLEQILLSYEKNNPTLPVPEQANTVTTQRKTCSYCKRKGHDQSECRAKSHTCGKCNKIGHFERRCRSLKGTHARSESNSSHFAFTATSTPFNCRESWIVDTGATTSKSARISPETKTSGETLTMANGTTVPVTGRSYTNIGFNITTVLCVPSAKRSLLSIGKACEDGDIDKATFDAKGFLIYKNDTIIASGVRRNGLYELEHHEVHTAIAPATIWHQRLAHTPTRTLAEITKMQMAIGINVKPETLMQYTLDSLDKLRLNESSTSIWIEARKCATDLACGIAFPGPETTMRTRTDIPNFMPGARQIDSQTQAIDWFRSNLFCAVIDKIRIELKDRFNDAKVKFLKFPMFLQPKRFSDFEKQHFIEFTEDNW